MQLHSAKVSQGVGIALTIIIELFFSFLAGWAMYDEFSSWGFYPGVIVGSLAGLVFLLLGLYVFILREYAVDANRIFARIRGYDAKQLGWRLFWAGFLVVAVILIETFINANRMIVLPIADMAAKVFLWLVFQAMVFVPFALGKLVHGHVNATDPAHEERQFYNELDTQFYRGIRQKLPSMSLAEIDQLRRGDASPLQQRYQAPEAEPDHPLAQSLRPHPPTQTTSSNGKTPTTI